MATIFQCDICGNADVHQQENFVGLVNDRITFVPKTMKSNKCRAHFCGDCYMRLTVAIKKIAEGKIIPDESNDKSA